MSKFDGSSPELSVIVPTYNSAQRIDRSISWISQAIECSRDVTVEVVIVDNGSEDGTLRVVASTLGKLQLPYRVVCVSESRSGAAFARLRGLQASAAPVVVFCDDDVEPAINSLREIHEFFLDRPEIGGCGGVIEAKLEPESKWPEWIDERLKSNLALSTQFTTAIYNPPNRYFPVSAFVAYRREALSSWAKYVHSGRFVLGPCKLQMWRGDDFEMALNVLRGPWKIAREPKIRAFHHISADRLKLDYFHSLMYWNGRSAQRVRCRWEHQGWWYCLSRFLWRICTRQARFHPGLRHIFAPQWAMAESERARANAQAINTMLHRTFAAGVLNEMARKIVNPLRF